MNGEVLITLTGSDKLQTFIELADAFKRPGVKAKIKIEDGEGSATFKLPDRVIKIKTG